MALWLATTGASARAADVMINNGGAPPAPENLIDHTNYSTDPIYVRNVDCPPAWPSGSPETNCPAPGLRTDVEVTVGGNVGILRLYDTSTVTIRGGSALGVIARGSSEASIRGGTLGSLSVNNSAWFTLNGGTLSNPLLCTDTSQARFRAGLASAAIRALGDCRMSIFGGDLIGPLEAYNDSVVYIYGTGFEVDGMPVPLGPISATSGRLTGALSSGHLLDLDILHAGHDSLLTGTIELRLMPGVSLPGLGVAGSMLCAVLLALSGMRIKLG